MKNLLIFNLLFFYTYAPSKLSDSILSIERSQRRGSETVISKERTANNSQFLSFEFNESRKLFFDKEKISNIQNNDEIEECDVELESESIFIVASKNNKAAIKEKEIAIILRRNERNLMQSNHEENSIGCDVSNDIKLTNANRIEKEAESEQKMPDTSTLQAESSKIANKNGKAEMPIFLEKRKAFFEYGAPEYLPLWNHNNEDMSIFGNFLIFVENIAKAKLHDLYAATRSASAGSGMFKINFNQCNEYIKMRGLRFMLSLFEYPVRNHEAKSDYDEQTAKRNFLLDLFRYTKLQLASEARMAVYNAIEEQKAADENHVQLRLYRFFDDVADYNRLESNLTEKLDERKNILENFQKTLLNQMTLSEQLQSFAKRYEIEEEIRLNKSNSETSLAGRNIRNSSDQGPSSSSDQEITRQIDSIFSGCKISNQSLKLKNERYSEFSESINSDEKYDEKRNLDEAVLICTCYRNADELFTQKAQDEMFEQSAINDFVRIE